MSDRPPTPPRRKCQVRGCDNTPLYPGKDWSTFCHEHVRAGRSSDPEPAPHPDLRPFVEWVRDVDPTTTTFHRVQQWAASLLNEVGAVPALQATGEPPSDLVARHTHDGANVLIYNLRTPEQGCRLCRALVAAGVLSIDEIGADTAALLRAGATGEGERHE